MKHDILISGSRGFVGQNLCHELEKQYVLHGINLREIHEVSSEVIFPISDKTAKANSFKAIIHLAGKAHDTSNTSDPESYFEVNTGLTKKLFDHFIASEAKLFIFVSSVKAVADSLGNQVLTEEHPPAPITPYGQSKLQAEEYIQSVSLPADKNVFILRPCMIHGPGNKGNLNLLYNIVKKGVVWPLGAYENQRSFLSIDNLIFCIKKIIDGDIPQGVYNIADDSSISTNEIINLMSESLGKKAKIWNISPKLIGMIAKMGDTLRLPLNTERLTKLTESYVVSNQKLKAALNITALPTSAKEGMLHTLKSFR